MSARHDSKSAPSASRTEYETWSGTVIRPLYGPADLAGRDLERTVGDPGAYPFVRGIRADMYRGKLWTMRQYAGFGTPEETNRRFKYLLDEGQTGLSVALDLPTQLGYDPDAPEAIGEVGKVGVAISSLADMETVFAGIPLDRVTTSFTINATAPILLAMYEAVAERQGVAKARIAGTVQNDLLKEFGARGAFIFPILPSLRLCVDVIEYCARELPRFNPISIASHYRDAGATPAEEMAYTLADGIAYVEASIARGLPVDEFAPRLSFFFYTYTNFFEEVAKYRAARRIWARLMKDRYGAENPESQRLRAACVCGGHLLTLAEPLNNIARTTVETMAVACAGLQSVFTAAYDEALAIPTELSARTALRVQQIVAYETDVAKTVDPLGGSWFVESLTDDMERAILGVMDEIEARGGMVRCLEDGYIQRRIAERAFAYQRGLDDGSVKVVGVNAFRASDEKAAGTEADVAIHRGDPEVEQQAVAALRTLREKRDGMKVEAALSSLRVASLGTGNLMAPIREAVRAYATVGEIAGCLRGVFGEYQPPRGF